MVKTGGARPQPQKPATTSLQAKFKRGVALHRQGKLAAAERIYGQVLQKSYAPSRVVALSAASGLCYGMQGRRGEDAQMVLRRIARWPLIITTLFSVSAAVAQTGSQQNAATAKFVEACGQDMRRLCVGVQPGEGRLVKCLMSHTSQVSAACRKIIAPAAR
jgi:hypothetical protein